MRTLLVIAVITVSIIATAPRSHASVESFADRMQRIVSAVEGGNDQIGISIISLNSGDTVYAHNQNLALNPASCTKIITTAAAMKLLGPDYRFHTEFYTDRQPVGGKAGKLWVKAKGDPSIVIERLWRIARDLANAGLTGIDGDIVIDDSYFEGYKYPGFAAGSGRAYNSLTGAASLNYNTITVIVSPSPNIGSPPHVALDTAGPYFRVVNTATTGQKGTKNEISAARTEKNGEDIIEITGSVPADFPPQHIYRNITDPPLYFGLALKSLMQQNGISVGGTVRHGRFPGGGYLLLDSISNPLSLIVRDMNKYSNNFIAEQIVNVLGAEIGGVPGTTQKGIQVIENFLSHLGIPPDSYSLVNGSGLTSENRISASILVTVLAHMFADFRIAPEALSSLSIAGVDGTIKSRLNSDRLKGIARAKTGLLDGVSTLAGTVPGENGEMLGYAILMNGNGLNPAASHRAQEDMLNAMVSFRR